MAIFSGKKESSLKSVEIYFSRHAKRQMRWRKISEEEIKDTVLHPEKIEDSIKGRKNALKH